MVSFLIKLLIVVDVSKRVWRESQILEGSIHFVKVSWDWLTINGSDTKAVAIVRYLV